MFRPLAKKTLSVLSAAALSITLTAAFTPSANALPNTKTVTVMTKTQKQKNPNLNTRELVGWYNKGTRVTLTCYTYGQAVKGWGSPGIRGGWDNLWYKTTQGVYTADVDLATGTNGPAVAKRCGTTSEPPAPKPTTTSLDKFYDKVRGKTVANAAGTYPGECVSLVSQYLLQVKNIRTGAWGNAIDYQTGGSGGNQMKKAGFVWRTDRNFKDGDIIVWGAYKNLVYGYGHIGIWYKGKVMEQNWAGRRWVALNPLQPGGIKGYWRKA